MSDHWDFPDRCEGFFTLQETTMPMKYDPDTGVPRYVPDLGEELEEGVTPKPDTITSKSAVFKGDAPLSKEQYEMLRDGEGKKLLDAAKAHADKQLDDIVTKANPARLDKTETTDEELDELERLSRNGAIPGWPTLLRLINRLRRVEGK